MTCFGLSKYNIYLKLLSSSNFHFIFSYFIKRNPTLSRNFWYIQNSIIIKFYLEWSKEDAFRLVWLPDLSFCSWLHPYGCTSGTFFLFIYKCNKFNWCHFSHSTTWMILNRKDCHQFKLLFPLSFIGQFDHPVGGEGMKEIYFSLL